MLQNITELQSNNEPHQGQQPCVRVGIVGAGGYTGAELALLCAQHPTFELIAVSSTSQAGVSLGEIYPRIKYTAADLILVTTQEMYALDLDAVFLAVPHTASADIAARFLELKTRVVDLAADFRLDDITSFNSSYNTTHPHPELLAQAVYGLPEINRAKIESTNLLANPGCYPTATLLASLPLMTAKPLAADTVIVSATSGVSGMGRSLSQSASFCVADESYGAYKPLAHQHAPEIAQELTKAAGRAISVAFVPHLAPFKRGILADVFVTFENPADADTEKLTELYLSTYKDEPFVHVLPAGQMPNVSQVCATNLAVIGISGDPTTGVAVISCAIDNLSKGAASQAVQNANIMFGLDETAGLTAIGSVI